MSKPKLPRLIYNEWVVNPVTKRISLLYHVTCYKDYMRRKGFSKLGKSLVRKLFNTYGARSIYFIVNAPSALTSDPLNQEHVFGVVGMVKI